MDGVLIRQTCTINVTNLNLFRREGAQKSLLGTRNYRILVPMITVAALAISYLFSPSKPTRPKPNGNPPDPLQNQNSSLLQYPLHGEYRPRHDYFDADSAAGKACLDRGGQRGIHRNHVSQYPAKGGRDELPVRQAKSLQKKGDAVFFHNVLIS